MVQLHIGMHAVDGNGYRGGIADRFAEYVETFNRLFPAPLLNGIYVMLAPEFYFGEEARNVGEIDQLEALTNRLSGRGTVLAIPGSIVVQGDNKYRNRSLISYSGRTLKRYSKHQHAGSTGVGSFRPGKKDGVFEVSHSGSKFTLGLEICADHAAGTLSKDRTSTALLSRRKSRQDVDVQIIVANSVTTTDANMCARDYVVLCNPSHAGLAARGTFTGGIVTDGGGARVEPTARVDGFTASWSLEI